MKREILVCDRCKTQAETPEEKETLGLGQIVIGFEIQYSGAYNSRKVWAANQQWSRDWCRECRAEVGILENENKRPIVSETAPSLEDMIRDIVREELPQ
jgi:hypothetical protein